MLRRSSRRWALCAASTATVALAVLATAAQSWACASLMAIDLTPAGPVAPGQEVQVRVTFVHKDKPVELRWDALDGPILAVIDPATFAEGLHGNWRFASTTITIPQNAQAGSHLLIANQEASRITALWGAPARGLVQVSSAGQPLVGQDPGPARVVRPADLVTEDSVSAGDMVVVGLGAAGATMLLAGIGVVVLASRRKEPGPQAAAVRTGARP
jgi:hypothetical protein